MPGVGKTQTAIEFAHRHRRGYRAVLWVQASSPEALISGYLALAQLLGLPQRNERIQADVVAAVLNWLRRTPGWLLILDRADDLGAVQDLLPTGGPGHLLLTTLDRAVVALAEPVEVTKMVPEEGARLLLQRAGRLATVAALEQAEEDDRQDALAISEAVDGLPLCSARPGATWSSAGSPRANTGSSTRPRGRD